MNIHDEEAKPRDSVTTRRHGDSMSCHSEDDSSECNDANSDSDGDLDVIGSNDDVIFS